MGAVQLLDASGTVIATAHLRGTGSAPQLVFPSNSATKTVGSGFSKPISVTVNGSGDVFVADSGNHKVYKIAATGGTVSQASTVVPVGSGFNAPAGVAVDASGDIFATDVVNNAVYEIVAVSGAVSSASTTIPVGSGFNYPWGVAVDASGNVFVADSGSNTVKKIVAVNGTVSSTSTVIPVGCGFSYPTGVAVDSSGNIFVADYGNSAIKEILAVNGAVSSTSTVITVGSGFSKPINLAIDAGGDVFVADSGNNAIYEIVAVNGAVSSTSIVIPVGSGFSVPPGVAVDASGNVFVADDGNSAVKEMMLATPPSLSFATTPINTVSSDSPQTVTIANNGNAPLTFVLPSLSGYYNPSVSANFSWNSSASTCMQASSGSGSAFTLSEGASCTIAIDFTPASAGSITGSTVLTNDSLNAPAPNYTTQAIGLSGTGTDAVTHFSVSIPSTATSGSSFDITVTAFDSANNTLSSYSGTVHFASSDGAAALPADSMLNHGVGTFSATLKTSGTQVITVTDMSSSITGTSNVITVSPAVVAPMISFTPRPNTQTYGTPIIAGSLDAMATYDGKPLTGAFTYTATVNGNPETLVAGTTVLPAGFYTITAKFTPTDSSLYQPVSLTASYSVTKAGTTVLLNAGNSQITPGTSVTLNAQVASATTGTPSGTISFYDGASLLNTITLAGGVASYSTASLSAGTHSLTAVYSGDANFTTSSTTASTAVSVMALDFTLTVAGPSTQTVLPSRSSTYQVAVTPLYGAYPDTVSFAASGLPSGATATFSPSSITVNGGAQTITVTIQNTMSTAMKHDSFFSRRLGSASLALLLLPLFGARDMRRYGRWLVRLACLLILVGITAGSVTGCGFSKGSSAQNYSVTIMATSGTVQHAATVTLRVQ
jgi:sugar lactone lactonase YvrE